MPKITICIPSYNYEEFIGQAIESVLSQTFKDFELIIIDCSTDKSWEIISGYKDDRIIKINSKFNKMSAKLNIAFEMAKGEYLTWLSADDYWKSTFLEKLLNIYKNHSDLDLVYSDCKTVRLLKEGTNPGKWVETEHGFTSPWIGNQALYRNMHCGIFWLFKKRVFEIIGKFDELSGEDYDYLLRIAEKNMKIMQSIEPLAVYRQHDRQSINALNMDKVRQDILLCANARGNIGQDYLKEANDTDKNNTK